MKPIHNLFAIATIGLLTISSCTQDEITPASEQGKGTPVNFTMGVNALTRTTTTDLATVFDEGDQVGIFAVGTINQNNIAYTKQGENWNGGITVNEGDTYSYYAYYPYSNSVTNATAAALSVATDQTTGYEESDVLTAQATNVTGTEVTLSYNHAFALVQVTLLSDESIEGATVRLANVLTQATVNLQDGTVTPGGTPGYVTMYPTGTNKTYRAVVPAQTIAPTAGYAVTIATADGKNYQFTHNANIEYKQGVLRRMTVQIGEYSGGSAITIIEGDEPITNWEEDTEGDVLDGKGEEVVIPPVNLITLPYAEGINSFSTVTGDGGLTATGWYSIRGAAAASTTYTVEEDAELGNQVVKIDYNGTGNSWYNNAFLYYDTNTGNANGVDPEKTFRVTFKAKTDITPTTNNTAIWCYVKLKTDNVFCAKAGVTEETIGQTNQTCYNFKLTNEWATYTADFTFSIVGEVGGIGSNTTENGTRHKLWSDLTNYDYYIGMAPRNTAGTYYITDVTFEELK